VARADFSALALEKRPEVRPFHLIGRRCTGVLDMPLCQGID
jgi:hypothetical protein